MIDLFGYYFLYLHSLIEKTLKPYYSSDKPSLDLYYFSRDKQLQRAFLSEIFDLNVGLHALSPSEFSASIDCTMHSSIYSSYWQGSSTVSSAAHANSSSVEYMFGQLCNPVPSPCKSSLSLLPHHIPIEYSTSDNIFTDINSAACHVNNLGSSGCSVILASHPDCALNSIPRILPYLLFIVSS